MKLFFGVCLVATLLSDYTNGLHVDKEHERSTLKIINGNKVPITKHPYLASLSIQGMFFGSGVVIDKKWILTTAFNVAWWDKSDLEFRVGSYQFNRGGQVLRTEAVFRHENYTGSWDYNVAVVKVKPIKFSDKVRAVKMATKGPKGGSKGTITGWGEPDQTGYPSQQMLETEVTVLDWETCQKNYSTALTSRMFCSLDNKRGPGMFDFGDPLIVGETVCGLFAGGHSYVPGQNPVIYSDVSSLNDWIKTTTNKNKFET